MVETIKIGDPEIEVVLRRNPRAKRLTLRLSRVDGKATLTMPPRVSLRAATRFASKQESWLRSHIAKAPDRLQPLIGSQVLFRGQDVPIIQADGKSARFDSGAIHVSDNQTGARLQAFMKTQARNFIAPAVKKYSTQIDRPVKGISLRDTRSRWGSCSTEGRLMFSWRLVMAPPEVLDYVAAHEVAHLVEMNHSRAYWSVVQNLMPDYQLHRDWLKQHGSKLHSFDFSA